MDKYFTKDKIEMVSVYFNFFNSIELLKNTYHLSFEYLVKLLEITYEKI